MKKVISEAGLEAGEMQTSVTMSPTSYEPWIPTKYGSRLGNTGRINIVVGRQSPIE